MEEALHRVKDYTANTSYTANIVNMQLLEEMSMKETHYCAHNKKTIYILYITQHFVRKCTACALLAKCTSCT